MLLSAGSLLLVLWFNAFAVWTSILASASLAWQIYDAVEKQREHVSGEVVFIRQPLPGKVEIAFTVRNPGARPIFVESLELRGYNDKDASTWKTIPWTSAPTETAAAPGQSLTATMTVKSLDVLKDFLQMQNCFCFCFQSQGGSSVRLWMDQKLKAKIYADLAFQQVNVVLNDRVL